MSFTHTQVDNALNAYTARLIMIICTLIMSACGGGGRDSGGVNNTSKVQPPQSITFIDTDPNAHEIGGTVVIKKAVDETAVNEYVVYWSNAASAKLSRLLSLAKSGTTLNGSIAENTRIPAGASHLLVVSKNTHQEMNNGVSTALIDNHSADVLPQARAMRFKDTDINSGQISGHVIFTPADDERRIVGYALHWANNEGQILSPGPNIASTLKTREPVLEQSIIIPNNTKIPDQARQLIVVAYNNTQLSSVGAVIKLLDFASNAQGRGPGGNGKTGRYDYGSADKPALPILRLPGNSAPQCVFDNGIVMAIDMSSQIDTRPRPTPQAPHTVDDELFPAYSFPCGNNNENIHKNINTAYSPLNDAFYFGNVTFNMFYDYLDDTPLTEKIRLRVHYDYDIPFSSWDGAYANFGDGRIINADTPMYPFTLLDVVAHEIAHGFTERYSTLFGGQAEAISEAFSDMVGEAAEHYLYGQPDWQHNNARAGTTQALRYFQYPSDDKFSIESLHDYDPSFSKQHNAGIFRKAFYLLVHSPGNFSSNTGWTLPLALKSFSLANQYCWQQDSTFEQAASCVLSESARVLYDIDTNCFGKETEPHCQHDLRKLRNDVRKAFAQVDINLDTGSTQAQFDVQNFLLDVRLTDTSKTVNGAIINSWLWDFGDGTPQSSEQSPTHIYAAKGRYPLQLSITDSDNNTDTYTREVSILDNYCSTVSISDRYWIAGVSIGEFTQYSDNAQPYQYFPGSGIGLTAGTQVPVNLLVGGSSLDRYWQIWIDYNRDSKFHHTNELAFQGFLRDNLQDSFTLPDNLPVGNSRMRIVMKPLEYLDRVCGNIGVGQVEDYDVSFNVQPLVDIELSFNANISANNTPAGTPVTFNNNSRVLTASTLQWDFGDGSAIVQQVVHPVHTYATAGTYPVTLTVTTPDNRTFSMVQNISIP